MKTEKKIKLTKLFIKLTVAFGFLCVGLAVFYLITVNTARKPAIYLYPEEDSFVTVKLRPHGVISKTDPEYDNSWNVFVTKEGVIDGKYDYLFYEVGLLNIGWPDAGWVVSYDNLDSWFQENLEKLGLNEKEKAQFVDYWLKELPKANYYEIKLADKDFLDKNMKLDVFPRPETEIRLLFGFRSLENELFLLEPEIITPERTGFTLVEWGGVLRK